jgi:hypothetical protein
MEREWDNMNRIFGTQVADPLRAMVTGAPLEDTQLLESAIKATKKSDWSKVRTYRLSTHTPPRFKLRI